MTIKRGVFDPLLVNGAWFDADTQAAGWWADELADVATSDVTVALTGQALSVARGSTAASTAAALTGQALTIAGGSVLAQTALAITGLAGSVAPGSVAPQASFALTSALLTVGQGSVLSPFADVPQINSAGRRKRQVVKPPAIVPVVPAIAPSVGLERQVADAQARESAAFAALQSLESRASAQLETLAKATVARRQAAVINQRSVAAALNAELETLNAEMAVEEARVRDETDLIFVFSILELT